eukprot:196177-Pyramimonas_sp.AAC.1
MSTTTAPPPPPPPTTTTTTTTTARAGPAACRSARSSLSGLPSAPPKHTSTMTMLRSGMSLYRGENSKIVWGLFFEYSWASFKVFFPTILWCWVLVLKRRCP